MTSLHIAAPDDLDRLLPMVEAFHAHVGHAPAPEDCLAAILPLLDGTPLGVIYLIGPRKSPVGYIALSFGWSIAAGGVIGRIDEFYIREAVRGRGMGSDVLLGLLPALADHGVRAILADCPAATTRAARLLTRTGFTVQEGVGQMRRNLA